LYIKRKEGRRSQLQSETTYKTEIISTKYKEDQLVNTAESHKSNKSNMNSTSHNVPYLVFIHALFY
jgi:hypothetical protein